jgi:hypothetical protein
MSCCDQPPRVSGHCVTLVAMPEPIGVPMALIPVIRAEAACRSVPLPCAFSTAVLNACQECHAWLQDPQSLTPSQSDRRQFTQCLKAQGILTCDSLVEYPGLWLQALVETVDRAGENFAQTYITLVQKNVKP